MDNYSILKSLLFSQTLDWNIKQRFNRQTIDSKFEKKPIGLAITRIKDSMVVEDNVEYKRLTIKINNGGVSVRDIVMGGKIKTKKQYYIKSGQLAVSKIDARNGAFGIVPEEADNAIITGNFWVYDIDFAKANIEFLILMFSAPKFVKVWEDCSNGSGNRLYLQESKFLDYKIPLPDINIQHRLVSQYNELIRQADEAECEGVVLENEIDKYLFDVLGIKECLLQEKSENVLNFVGFKQLFKWGVETNLNAISPTELFESQSYRNLPISYFCEINPTTSISKDIEDVSFLPMECISDVYGDIIELREGETKNAKGYTKFKENDVLWAKITPCMQNGKCAIAKKLKNGYGYGSTEYHVFRAKEDKVLPEFLYCFLRTRAVRNLAKIYFTGSAGQQRVGADFLEALTLPNIPVRSDDATVLTQEVIVNKIFEMKTQIKELKTKAINLKMQAKKQFEEAVFDE